MELREIWKKKEPSQEQIMAQQHELQKDNIITENATHPQHNDQAWLAEQREKYADLRRWQQDLSPKFKEMFENLCGHRVVDSGIVKIDYINPVMNINGAYHIVNFLKNIDVNVIMSNYEEFGIQKALRYGVGRPVLSMIRHNYRAYGMNKNIADFKYVLNMAMNSAEPTFNRAWKGGEREVDSKIMRISRMENEKQEEKKGIFK